LKLAYLQVQHHETAQAQQVEQKIDSKLLAAHLDRILAADERKADSELQKEIANVIDQGALQLPLACFFGEGEELEIVRVLDDLLRQLRLRSRQSAAKFVSA
jgi:hypothetical protein